jgi:hypothetical protein
MRPPEPFRAGRDRAGQPAGSAPRTVLRPVLGPGLWGWQHKHTIKVKVTGFAAAGGGFWVPGTRSYSAAYVTIVPPGWWWAF